MSDPFNSLRGVTPQVDPDTDFVDAVMRAVEERLDAPAVAPTYDRDSDTDIIELDVIQKRARPAWTWWLIGAAAAVVVLGLFGIAALTSIGPDTKTTVPPLTSVVPDTTT